MFMMLLKDLRIAPMRTFLTGFSMFVGIIAVILSVLVGTIGQSYVTAINEQIFGRKTTYNARASEARFTDYATASKASAALNRAYAAATIVFEPKQTLFYSPQPDYINQLQEQNSQTQLQVKEILSDKQFIEALYVTDGYNQVFNLPLSSGQWFTAKQGERLEVVVNKPFHKSYTDSKAVYVFSGESTNPVPLPIIGVVNDGKDQPAIYVNALSFAKYAPQLWNSTSLEFYLHDQTAQLGEDSIKAVLRDILYDSGKGKLETVSVSSELSVYEDLTETLQKTFGITAVLLLFVAAVGLINIGLASLEQRAHELLIRRALGASRSSIVVLVLGGALFLALIVVSLAIGIAAAIVAGAGLFLPYDTPITPPVFPVKAALIATGAALITALLGSIIPAIQASRLQPALALR